MEVTNITQYRSRELVALFRHLMHRAERGELEGSAIAVKPYGAGTEVLFTDYFKRNSSDALRASLQLSTQLNQIQDQLMAGNG